MILQTNNQKGIVFSLLFIGIFVLYATIAFHTTGYDDEFFNINIVENFTLHEIIALPISANPHHPNYAIAINKLLYLYFNDWSIVRLINSALFSTALFTFFYFISKSLPLKQQFFLFLITCLNPTFLMWGTSLRWYVYFLPMMMGFILHLKYNSTKNYFIHYLISFALFFIMLHINYVALIVCPILIFLFWYQRKFNKNDLLTLIILTIAFILFSYSELVYFFQKYFIYGQEQMTSLGNSIFGLGLHLLSNMGSFPFSLGGMLYMLSMLILLFVGIFHINKLDRTNLLFLILGYLVFIFAAIGAKYRNFVVFIPSESIIKGNIFALVKPRIQTLILVLLVISSSIGIYHIMHHRDSLKGSWNLPVYEVIQYIDSTSLMHSCDNIMILTTEPVLNWHLSQNFKDVQLSIRGMFHNYLLNSKADCRYLIKTFPGSYNFQIYKESVSLIMENYSPKEVFLIDRESSARFKKIVDPNYPDHIVEILFFKDD